MLIRKGGMNEALRGVEVESSGSRDLGGRGSRQKAGSIGGTAGVSRVSDKELLLVFYERVAIFSGPP